MSLFSDCGSSGALNLGKTRSAAAKSVLLLRGAATADVLFPLLLYACLLRCHPSLMDRFGTAGKQYPCWEAVLVLGSSSIAVLCCARSFHIPEIREVKLRPVTGKPS